MIKVTVTVESETVNQTITCDLKSINFERMNNGDGVVSFPSGDSFIKLVIDKDNIS